MVSRLSMAISFRLAVGVFFGANVLAASLFSSSKVPILGGLELFLERKQAPHTSNREGTVA
jgi:hypothetical protein